MKVVSSTNPDGVYMLAESVVKLTTGRPQLTETLRPGVVSLALGYGRWATGARDVAIDGDMIEGDPCRAAGVHANAAIWIDPALKNTCLLDPAGGSVSFPDSKIKLVKMPEGTLPKLRGRLLRESHA